MERELAEYMRRTVVALHEQAAKLAPARDKAAGDARAAAARAKELQAKFVEIDAIYQALTCAACDLAGEVDKDGSGTSA